MREFPGRFKGGGKIYSESGENERPGALAAVVVWKRNERALGAGERSLLALQGQQGAVWCHTNGSLVLSQTYLVYYSSTKYTGKKSV